MKLADNYYSRCYLNIVRNFYTNVVFQMGHDKTLIRKVPFGKGLNDSRCCCGLWEKHSTPGKIDGDIIRMYNITFAQYLVYLEAIWGISCDKSDNWRCILNGYFRRKIIWGLAWEENRVIKDFWSGKAKRTPQLQ